MKIWIDDIRPAPKGYQWCKTVNQAINMIQGFEDDVVVKSGHFAVNAKSLMGLYSLDLTKPLKVEFYGNIPYEVRDDLKKFIIEE